MSPGSLSLAEPVLCSHCRGLNTDPSMGLEQERTKKLPDFHFRYKKWRLTDKERHCHKGRSPCSVWMPLLQLVASPSQDAGLFTYWLPVPYLSCDSVRGVSPALSTSGEDAGAELGAFWMAFSSLFMTAPEKAGSLVGDFRSAKSRGKN